MSEVKKFIVSGKTISIPSVDINTVDDRIDAKISEWAQQPTKPTYTAEEVGAAEINHTHTPEEIGALSADTEIPTKTSQLDNDSGFLSEHQEIKTLNHNSLVGSENINLKTINSQSLIGDGDIVIEEYTLPTASDSTLGGIKIGTGLHIESNGVVSIYSTTPSSIYAGDNIRISSGTISALGYTYDEVNHSLETGHETDADGQYSNADGYFTSAEGQASHAEGNTTTALGQSAHAEGEGGNVTLLQVTTNGYTSSTTLYYSNLSSDNNSASDSSFNFLVGSDFASDSDISSFLPNSSDLATGAKYFIEKGNKLAGWIGRTLYYANGDVIGIITRFPDRTQEENGDWFEIDRSVLISDNTPAYIKSGASGESSHSEGYLTDVSGKYGHSEGERTQSTGTAAHSEGSRTKAFGAHSHAEGLQTQALAFGTHTEGMYTHAEGEYSHAEGYDTKSSGTYSHGEGFHSVADADYSHAEGHDSKASGIGSHSEGYVSVAHGNYSHAEGYNTKTEAKYSHSEGKDTYAQGEISHVEGENTLTNGKGAHAEGYETQAHADFTHTEGWKSVTEVRDDWVKIGTVQVKSVTNNYAQSLPAFNFDVISNQSAIESAFDEARPVIVKFKNKELNEHFNLINYILDNNAIVDGDFAVSPYGTKEYGAFASSWNSDYIGYTFDVYRKYVSGIASHAEGFETLTEGSYSHAEGEKTQTKNRAEHAQGYRNKSHQNSFTLGDPGNTIFSVGIGNNHNVKPITIPENLGNCYSGGENSYNLSNESKTYLQYSDDSISSFSYYIITDTLENLEIFVGSKIFYKDFSDPITYPNGENISLGIVTSAARIDVPSGQDPTDDNYKIYFELDEYTALPESPIVVYRTYTKPPVQESQEDKRNALEIMQNGDVYIKGLGNYDNGHGLNECYTLQQVIKDLYSKITKLNKLIESQQQVL